MPEVLPGKSTSESRRRQGRFCLAGILAGILGALAGCAGPAKPPAAVPGAALPAPSEPIPWTAAIGHLQAPSESSSCTATLVAPAIIVTAAHCIFPSGKKLAATDLVFTPNAGAQSLPSVGVAEIVDLGVERMNPDKPAETPTELDWAVLRLEVPISDIAPIPVEPLGLAEIDRRMQSGYTLSSLGYGQYGFAFAAHLYRSENCKLIPEWRQLAAAASDRLVMTTCQVVQGDSGGPLLIGKPDEDRSLIAVVSRFWRRPDGSISLAVGAGAFTKQLKLAIEAEP